MTSPSTGFIRSLRPRDPHEQNRVVSPLELFTDLCFVVAVSQAAIGLHHAVSDGAVGHGVLAFGMAFFAVFWAWLNFTWFASAYDNDDVLYRLLTILQILGSLVLAAGIQKMFDSDFTLSVTGYVIMRIALVAQWLRAASGDPERRRTAQRYALGIFVVQALWVAFLLVPPSLVVPAFAVLALLDVAVPYLAERAGDTPWHAHHVAERYGLFFIIVLGETVLSTTVAIQQAISSESVAWQLTYVVVGGVLIVFSVWWIYFAREAAVALERMQEAANNEPYVWGFGHYFVFASGAGIGAGLAARVDYWTHADHAEALPTAATVTVSVAVLLAALWIIQLRHHDASRRTWMPFSSAIVLILAATFTPVPEVLTGLICAILLVVEVRLANLTRSFLPG